MTDHAPPASKRQRLERPVGSVVSAERDLRPSGYRLGRTLAVRFHKSSRSWRVGRLVKVVPGKQDASRTRERTQYSLAFDDDGVPTEVLSEQQFTKSVLLNQVGVGTRISVCWKQPHAGNQYHAATVTKLRESSREAWYVAYDFGECEWINLAKTTFRILQQPNGMDVADEESDLLQSEAEVEKRNAAENDSAAALALPCPGLLRPGKSLSQHIALSKSKQALAKTMLRPAAAAAVSDNPLREPMENNDSSKLEFWGAPDNVRHVQKGCRIGVWWPGERFAVEATIIAQRKDAFRLAYILRGCHKEWVDLRKQRFKILCTADGKETLRPKADSYTLLEPQGDMDTTIIIVGSRLSIYWASLDEFRDCIVLDKKSDGRTKPYWIEYRTGDREWINFDRLIWKFQPAQENHETQSHSMISAGPSSSSSPIISVSLEMAKTIYDDDLTGSAVFDKEASACDILSVEKPLDDVLSQIALSDEQGDWEPSVGAITASPSPPSEDYYCDDNLDEVEAEEAGGVREFGGWKAGSSPTDAPVKKARGRPSNEKLSRKSTSSRIPKARKESPANLRTDAIEEVTAGSKIKIYQYCDNSWTNVMVTNIRLGFGALTHQVEYEDGKCKWLDFSGLTFRFLRGSIRRTEEADDSSDETDVAPEQEDNELEIVPGSKIRIWNPSTTAHFIATVLRYRRDGREEPYYVELETGEREWTGFQNRSFRFCPGSKRCHSPRRKTKLYVFPDIQVGTRLHVWWDSHGRWFVATVTKIKPDRERPHFLEYDDGDKEWLDLQRKRFLVHSAARLSSKRKSPSGKKKEKKNVGSKRRRADSFDSESGLEDAYSDDELDWCNKSEMTPKPATRGDGGKSDSQPPMKKRKSAQHAASAVAAERMPGMHGRRKNRDKHPSKVVTGSLPREPEPTSNVRQVSDRSDSESKRTKALTARGSSKKSKANNREHHEPANDKEARKLIASIREGSRVSVWWDGENAFFSGTVTLVRDAKRPFCLEYDDGDREWVDLMNERFRVL